MILDEIVARKKQQLQEEAAILPLSVLEKRASAAPAALDFEGCLRQNGLSVIAEVKKASPSKGIITDTFRPVETAKAYVEGGASAISVLTERHFFGGGDEILMQIRSEVKLPILRKDFMISERQVIEARAIGADAILLIAAILSDKDMMRYYQLATDLGLHCLFEAHTADETKRIAQTGARIIGINNRNLNTFAVDLSQFGQMYPHIPKDAVAVAESGIRNEQDAMWLRNAGADAILVGETLMRSGDIPNTLRTLKGS